MDENSIKLLLEEYKNEMIAQMKESEKSIKASVKTDIKESEKTIRTDIEVIKADVASNRSELEKLKERVDVMEVKQKSEKVVNENVAFKHKETRFQTGRNKRAECKIRSLRIRYYSVPVQTLHCRLRFYVEE